MVGIENILPDISEGVGVPEGQYVEGRVGSQYTLDILSLLLDVVSMEGSVGLITDVTIPIDQVESVLPTDDHGVREQHLLNMGKCQYGCYEAKS